MQIAGIGPTLIGAKLLACAGGILLYRRGGHVWLAALSVSYAYGAVMPWLQELSRM